MGGSAALNDGCVLPPAHAGLHSVLIAKPSVALRCTLGFMLCACYAGSVARQRGVLTFLFLLGTERTR
jgi:hypothetical protein